MDSISSTGNSSNGSLHGSSEMMKKDDMKSEDETKKRAKELFEKLEFLKKDKRSEAAPQKVPSDMEDTVFDHGLPKDAPPTTFPSLQHLLPNTEKEKKEPMKKPPQKQQIKLTLINKNEQPKFSSLPKEVDTKSKLEDKSLKNTFHSTGKRPLSPPSPSEHGKPPTNMASKKSASSRRDELLKQLKAVEDAIARKRAKFC